MATCLGQRKHSQPVQHPAPSTSSIRQNLAIWDSA